MHLKGAVLGEKKSTGLFFQDERQQAGAIGDSKNAAC
jgi:hypothetical protein